MPVATEFSRHVCVIENEWIPLADGTRLAARLWLPEDAELNSKKFEMFSDRHVVCLYGGPNRCRYSIELTNAVTMPRGSLV